MPYVCGTNYSYVRGKCRCDKCKAAHSAVLKPYTAKYNSLREYRRRQANTGRKPLPPPKLPPATLRAPQLDCVPFLKPSGYKLRLTEADALKQARGL